MKRITIILAIICIFSYTNYGIAQDDGNYNRNFKFGVGLNTGLPLNDPYQFNLGGDVRVQYNISSTYSLSFTTGYNNLFVKDDGVDFGYIPVKVGYKTFMFKNEFYVMGEIGGAFSTTKAYKDNSMLFSPSIGYATKNIDFSLRYEFLKDFPIIKKSAANEGLAQVMVRIAYGFNL
ncbi:hypothetical protein [Mariniflexile sp.]|uniref:hypothetical protein n=1 Tax=Mariniflexile sp. TaxID=1979402 RepID=UPI004047E3F2